jgi:hypothetical protein
MKQTKQQEKYNLVNEILHKSICRNSEGSIKIFPNNTFRHEEVKSQVAIKLKQLGGELYSEVEFKTGGRADLVYIDLNSNGYIIEILNSETDKKFEEKVKKYPSNFEIIKIKVKNFDINKWDL